MAEFDTIAKHLIHTYPTDFARFALQQDDIQVRGVVETEQKRHSRENGNHRRNPSHR